MAPTAKEKPVKSGGDKSNNKKLGGNEKSSHGKREAHWNTMFERLKTYAEEHGNCNIPTNYDKDPQLGKWIHEQRKNGNIPKHRKDLLDGINFIWDVPEFCWNEMYEKLKAYKEEHGNCNVPGPWKPNSNSPLDSLGKWVTKQRQLYKKNNLQQHRINQLEEIGFDWEPFAQQWDNMYQKLKQYKEENGDCNVSKRDKPNSSIGTWVHRQRQSYRNKTLSKERIKSLEDIGFVWDHTDYSADNLQQKWNAMLQRLKEYKKKNGHCHVKDGDEVALVEWARRQRKGYRNKTLSRERIKSLEDLGFVWDVKEQRWDKMYLQLQEYKSKHGDFNVPEIYPQNPALGRWTHSQHRDFRNKTLSHERMSLLQETGFIFNTDIDPDSDDMDLEPPTAVENNEPATTGTNATNVAQRQDIICPIFFKQTREENKRLAEENRHLAEENKRLAEENKRLAEENKQQAETATGTEEKDVTQEQYDICREVLRETREENKRLAEENEQQAEKIRRLKEEIQRLKTAVQSLTH